MSSIHRLIRLLSIQRLFPLARMHIRPFASLLLAIWLILSLNACSTLTSDLLSLPPLLLQADDRFKEQPSETPTPTPRTTLLSPSTKSLPTNSQVTAIPTQLPPSRTPINTITANLSPTRTPKMLKVSDLLYLAQGRLMRWDHIRGVSLPLVEGILEYSSSADGKKIALLKKAGMTANGIEMIDLALFDFNTKQVTKIMEGNSRLYEISISPSGKWIVYTDKPNAGDIYLLPIQPQATPIKLGTCLQELGTPCQDITWSPDSRKIAWSDSRGIWISEVPRGTTTLLLPDTVQVIDPKGNQSEIHVSFSDLVWSPMGRFILVRVIPSNQGVRWYGILDTRQGRLIDIPDTFEFSDARSQAIWMPNGDLLVMQSGFSLNDSPPYLQLWKVVPTRNDLLMEKAAYHLDTEQFPALPEVEGKTINYFPRWVFQNTEGNYNFALSIQDTSIPIQLFQLDVKRNTLQKFAEIPATTQEILWAPDGLGALVINSQNELIFVPMTGTLMVNLQAALGEDAHDFTWLPAIPR